MVEKVIILGSGPAGLSAAIYTAREGFEPLVISGYNGGGQLILTTLVENIPGFPDGIMGPEYMQMLMKQAKRFGTRFVDRDATKIDLQARPFKVYVEDQVYETHSVIVATGANAKYLGLESEKKFMGRGVSSCATCDAAFFKNKRVIVVGGGDTAMEDSLFLTRFAIRR
jgi:thioredoxin reductase (NADPH)